MTSGDYNLETKSTRTSSQYWMLPDDMARSLVELGLAQPATTKSLDLFGLVITGAAVSATVISLIQGPTTIDELRRLLKRRKEGRGADSLRIEIQTKGTTVTTDINDEDDLEKVMAIIKDLMDGNSSGYDDKN